MKKHIVTVFIFSFLFSCNTNETEIKSEQTQDSDNHTSQNSLDWKGTYEGTTPCADCEGIDTELTLNDDLTFKLSTIYLGKNENNRFEYTGSFSWSNDGKYVILNGVENGPSKYKVGENNVIQLDLEGNLITGDLAHRYVLVKL